jgi:hypothetical protein
MTTSLDNFTIRDALLARGFSDITSENRSTKTWRLRHPQMRHWVSVKRAEDVQRPMSKAPLVVHPDDARRVQTYVGAQPSIQFEAEPYKGSSAKYDGLPGVAISLTSLAALDDFVRAATGARSASMGGATAVASPTLPTRDAEVPPAVGIDPWLLAAAAAEVDADIAGRPVSATTRLQLIDARLGQGRFREDMLRIWGGRCAVTGCGVVRALIASHAIAWREDTRPEVRLDPYNGLLLTASIDKLFDLGMISFAEDGRLLHRPSLSASDLAHLGLAAGARLRAVDARHRPYLAAHRARNGF